MGADADIKRRRKLVVLFYAEKVDDNWLMERIIASDQGNHPQLVHRQLVHQSEIYRPGAVEKRHSGISHFFVRSKPNPRSATLKPSPSTASLAVEVSRSPVDQAVWEAYRFVARNHRPDDDVVLLVNTWTEKLDGGEYQLESAQTLARHLHNGTGPRNPAEYPYDSEDIVTDKQITVSCVAVISLAIADSISKWNDQLRTRFPPGVQHIICWSQSGNDQTCSTTCDQAGNLISREICIHQNAYVGYRTFIYSTRDLMYYKQEEIPKWGVYSPDWTQTYASTGVNPAEGPVGMYQHELSKYWYPERLVWKSSRYRS